MIKLNFKITAEFSCSSTKKPNNNHTTLSAISKIAFIDRSFHRELPRSRNQCLSNWSIFHSRPVESQYCYICRHQRMRVKTEPASFYQRVLLSLQRKRPVTVNCPELLLSFPQWHWSSISDIEIILSSGESTLIRRTQKSLFYSLDQLESTEQTTNKYQYLSTCTRLRTLTHVRELQYKSFWYKVFKYSLLFDSFSHSLSSSPYASAGFKGSRLPFP